MGGPQYDRNFGGYRVFCGDLGSRTNKYELEREFDSFGPLVDCWVARNPPGFAFIVYRHADDAERAVEELDGRTICGRRVRVEHARPTGGKKAGSFGRGYLRQRSPGYRSPDSRRDNEDDRRGRRRDRRRSPSQSRSRSSSPDEGRSSRRHRHRSRSRSHSRPKKASKRKHRSSSSRSPVEKKHSRQRSSSRERSLTPADKSRRDRSSRSASKEDADEKKDRNKNDNEESNNEKNYHDDNDESRSTPPADDADMKNNDED